ncbi:hypothetical protein [Sphingobium yanoikuyae]|uniref:hypothetical protein n=1 Tax=Sphingobium yanoikuyae TaxID=13690 RepID=UPI0035C69F91
MSQITDSKWFRVGTIIALPLSIIGFVIAVPPVQDFLFGKKTSLNISAVSQIPMFGVRKPLPGLRIFLDNKNLLDSDKNIIISQVRITNNGDVSVTPSNTTKTDPIGFQIHGGDILKVSGFTTNSSHLKRFAKPSLNNNRIYIDHDAIIDPGDFIQIDLLIINPNESDISYANLGKISGLSEITVSQFGENESVSFIDQVYSGTILVQIARILSYSALSFIFVIISVSAIEQGKKYVYKSRRSKRFNVAHALRSHNSTMDTELRDFIADLYSIVGIESFIELTNNLDRSPKLINANKKDKENLKFIDETKFEDGYKPHEMYWFTFVDGIAIYDIYNKESGELNKNVIRGMRSFIDRLNEFYLMAQKNPRAIDPPVNKAVWAYNRDWVDDSIKHQEELESIKFE